MTPDVIMKLEEEIARQQAIIRTFPEQHYIVVEAKRQLSILAGTLELITT